MNLVGESVGENSRVYLPSGTSEFESDRPAMSRVSGVILDVSGTAQTFYDLTEYTSGGNITLTSAAGDVALLPGSTVSVAAESLAEEMPEVLS